MTIRNDLREDECIYPSTGHVALFLGKCKGLRLSTRGEADDHLMFEVLVEDDGQWFVSKGASSSSWLPELIGVAQAAQEWLEKNAEPDMHNGRQYGWRLGEGYGPQPG